MTLIAMCSLCVASVSCDRNINFLSVGELDTGSIAQTIFDVTCGEWAAHPATRRSTATGLQCMQGIRLQEFSDVFTVCSFKVVLTLVVSIKELSRDAIQVHLQFKPSKRNYIFFF